MAKVAGMASRLVRGTAIACGVAAIAGVGLGLAAGKPVDPEDVTPARKLPADLCSRLGDVSSLLPKATGTAVKPVKLPQTGVSDVRCALGADEAAQSTYTAANLAITITPYAGKLGGAGQPPITPDTVAQQTFDRKPAKEVENRPYPTKLTSVGQAGGQAWQTSVIVVRADLVVQVDYSAHPIAREAAEKTALVMADRAIWEAK